MLPFNMDASTHDVFDDLCENDEAFIARLRAAIRDYPSTESEQFFSWLFDAPEWKVYYIAP
jgi:hypothetical protein